MTSNKPRLYVALYGRGGREGGLEDAGPTYHWALIVGPKNEVDSDEGMRYHARQRIDGDTRHIKWIYQALKISVQPTAMLLVRVLIAKVTSKSQLVQTLENVPIIQDDTSWTCRIWVRDALAALEADGRSLGTRVTDWSTVEEKTKWYVGLKEDQQRFDGSGQWDRTKAPTYDLLDGRETIA